MHQKKSLYSRVDRFKRDLPSNWRVIKVWDDDGVRSFQFISPSGKVFTSLERAQKFVDQQNNKESKEKINEILSTFFAADGSPILSEFARKKRKSMAEKNPARNLRQRICENNLITEASLQHYNPYTLQDYSAREMKMNVAAASKKYQESRGGRRAGDAGKVSKKSQGF